MWNGVEEPRRTFHEKEKFDKYGSGYCVHGEITFPTWHRPYIAMMEVSQIPDDISCFHLLTFPSKLYSSRWSKLLKHLRTRKGT